MQDLSGSKIDSEFNIRHGRLILSGAGDPGPELIKRGRSGTRLRVACGRVNRSAEAPAPASDRKHY